MKNVFLDTNVLLEILCNRRYCKSCEQILMRGKNGHINLFASFLTFANMAYVLQREKINREDIYTAERMMEAMITVLPMDGDQLRAALRNQVKDFEDMLQYQSALAGQCDCIVTINTNDFVEFSSLPVYSPEGLLDLLDKESI